MKRSILLSTGLLTALLLAGGAGDSGSTATGSGSGSGSVAETTSAAPTESTSGEPNAADVKFAQSMILHHAQAIQMAEMALKNGGPEVKTLAAEVKAAQGPEIETLSGWLEAWGEEVPEVATGSGGMGGMGGTDAATMPGMMPAEDLDRLMAARGAEFDRMFLTMMVEHHTGAIEMARMEQEDGAFAEAKAMAAQIEKAQTEEVSRMQGLLR